MSCCRSALAIAACCAASVVLAQTLPEIPRPGAGPVAPSVPTEAERNAEKNAERNAEKKAAAQRVQDKRDADRRMAEAAAQAERERQARMRAEVSKRRQEAEKAEFERRARNAERTSAAPAPVAPVELPGPPIIARHPHMAEPLSAGQTFVDSWGQGSVRESAPRMVVVPPAPAGGFLMGSPAGEMGRDANEKQHRVNINYVFALSETEITFAQWNACVADGGCGGDRNSGGWGRDQYPAVNVNWQAARAYADWLNSRFRFARNDPYRYRLPSEAEWEFAARAGNAGPFGFAQNKNIAPDLANYDTRGSYQGSATRDGTQGATPVGSYPASAFGIKDMLGNVWEWVADCYEADYDRTPKDGSAYRENDNTCALRVVRGGSWYFAPEELRTANRFWSNPAYHDNKGGFRVARTLMSKN